MDAKTAAYEHQLQRLHQWLRERPLIDPEELPGADTETLERVRSILAEVWMAIGIPESQYLRQRPDDTVMRYIAQAIEDSAPNGVHAQLVQHAARLCHLNQQLHLEIRERQHTEEALKESEARYRHLVDSSLGFICTHDLSGVMLSVNPATARALGYEPHEIIGRNWQDFLELKQPDLFDAYLKQIRREHQSEGLMRVRSRLGESRMWFYRNILIEDSTNGPYVLGHAHDLTKRVLAERALKASEQRFRTLVEGSIQGIGIHRNFKPLFVNPAYAQIFGYDSPEEILRLDSVLSLIAPHEHARLRRYQRVRLRGEQLPGRYDLQGHHRDGRVIWLETFFTMVKWQGEPASLVGFVDVTKRKQAEQAAQQSQHRLWELMTHLQARQEAERRHIARELHDDLGQGLTALQLDLEWLSSRASEYGLGGKKLLQAMGERVGGLIETVRRVGTALRPGVLDDLGLVAAIEDQLQEVCHRTGLRYSLSVPSSELGLESSRATAVYRIFQEALTNVVRHASAHTVKVRLSQDVDTLMLEVCDDGRGISEDEVSAPVSLGVSGMRERAELWGGELLLEGRPGAGTRLLVRIPCGQTAAERAVS